MRIIIKESQLDLIRRVYEIGEIVNGVINILNYDIKMGGPGNKPDNFGVYEGWVVNRVERLFSTIHPDIKFKRIELLMLVSEQFNKEIRKGFNKVRTKK